MNREAASIENPVINSPYVEPPLFRGRFLVLVGPAR